MLLEVEDLSISFQREYSQVSAVRELSFKVNKGETLGVVGESGCGKSITNLALLGLLPPNTILKAKKLSYQGQDLLSLNEKQWRKIRGKEISIIFQDPMSALNPCFNVEFQLTEVLNLHFPNLTKKEKHFRCIELLEHVGIPAPEERLKNFPHQLSGGMAQRIMIAIAIASKPKMIIADEPTTALDVTIQDQILRLLKDLQKEHDMGMILVTHDLGVVSQNSNRIQVMYAGEIVESGLTQDIIHHPTHPYTIGLIKSLPEAQEKAFRSELPHIKGIVPDIAHRPKGCQFAPRCFAAQEKCKESIPSLEQKTDRRFRCYFPQQEHIL